MLYTEINVGLTLGSQKNVRPAQTTEVVVGGDRIGYRYYKYRLVARRKLITKYFL